MKESFLFFSQKRKKENQSLCEGAALGDVSSFSHSKQWARSCWGHQTRPLSGRFGPEEQRCAVWLQPWWSGERALSGPQEGQVLPWSATVALWPRITFSPLPSVGFRLHCGCLVFQSCPTLCDPTDCSPPGSSVHGVSQARILEWVVIFSSKETSRSRDQTRVSCIGRYSLPLSHQGSPLGYIVFLKH